MGYSIPLRSAMNYHRNITRNTTAIYSSDSDDFFIGEDDCHAKYQLEGALTFIAVFPFRTPQFPDVDHMRV